MKLSEVAYKIGVESARTAINAGAGYMGVWVLTSLNPIAGGICGAGTYILGTSIKKLDKDPTLKSGFLLLALSTTTSALVTIKAVGLTLSAATFAGIAGSYLLGLSVALVLTTIVGIPIYCIAKRCGIVPQTV